MAPSYIVLHKSEWERLHKKYEPSDNAVDINRERLKKLDELSQKWIKTWPDTVAGRVALVEKQRKLQKKKQHQEDIAFLKAYTRKMKEGTTAEAIKQARHMVFQNSSYGRQLLSALLESKAVEEREAQIKFNHAIKEEAAKRAKEENKTLKGGINDFHDKDEERNKEDKLKRLENDRVNKEIVKMKKEKESQEKINEKKSLIEDEKFMKQIIEIETKQLEEVKRCEKQKLEEYVADSKRNALLKEHDHKLADAITDVYKREQERIWLKSRAVMRKIHLGRPDTEWSKNIYAKIKHIQDEEKKKYDDFIDKGVKAKEKRLIESDFDQKLKEKQKKSNLYLTAQRHKIVAYEQNEDKKCENKCVCEKQTLALISSRNFKKKNESKAFESSKTLFDLEMERKMCETSKKTTKLSFLVPNNTLIEELRKREKEPSPYSGTHSAHVHFAKQADDVLKEIKHKYFARKVVDEYRKLNCLNATTLPVPNY